MGLTVSRLSPSPDMAVGNRKWRFRTIVFDSSYPTGGESLTAADLGLKRLITAKSYAAINDQGAGDSTKTLVTRYNHTSSKLQAFWSAGSGNAPVEVTDTTDLQTYSCRIEAIGW